MVSLQRTVALWRILPNESPATGAGQGIAERLSAVSTTKPRRLFVIEMRSQIRLRDISGCLGEYGAQGTLRHRVVVGDDQRFVPAWRHTPHLEVLCPTDADEPEASEDINHLLAGEDFNLDFSNKGSAPGLRI